MYAEKQKKKGHVGKCEREKVNNKRTSMHRNDPYTNFTTSIKGGPITQLAKNKTDWEQYKEDNKVVMDQASTESYKYVYGSIDDQVDVEKVVNFFGRDERGVVTPDMINKMKLNHPDIDLRGPSARAIHDGDKGAFDGVIKLQINDNNSVHLDSVLNMPVLHMQGDTIKRVDPPGKDILRAVITEAVARKHNAPNIDWKGEQVNIEPPSVYIPDVVHKGARDALGQFMFETYPLPHGGYPEIKEKFLAKIKENKMGLNTSLTLKQDAAEAVGPLINKGPVRLATSLNDDLKVTEVQFEAERDPNTKALEIGHFNVKLVQGESQKNLDAFAAKLYTP